MTPEIGSRWKHYNGIEYVVIGVANQASSSVDYPVTVVYSGPHQRLWARSLSDWNRSMKEITNDT